MRKATGCSKHPDLFFNTHYSYAAPAWSQTISVMGSLPEKKQMVRRDSKGDVIVIQDVRGEFLVFMLFGFSSFLAPLNVVLFIYDVLP